MLRSVEDAEVGRIVYLYPHTKTAGQFCWMKKTAVIEDGKTHWPRVKVSLTHEGNEVISYPHKDDIRLRPVAATTKQEKRDGDMVGTVTGTKVRVMPGRVKEMELPDEMEQPGLW
jgi:hypothetical protein